VSDTGFNPYAPPQSPLLAPEAPPTLEELAGAGRRFLNNLVDSLAVFVAQVIVFALAFGEEQGSAAASVGITLGANVVYYAAFEWRNGRTLGKLLTGTRVVSEDGTKPRLRRIVGRTLARFIPFDAFSFLGGEQGRPVGWHDSLSRTRVVRVRRDRG
jgi:uncharacterized RDD family membrane protein YckC